MFKDLLPHILPKELLVFFTATSIASEDTKLDIYLEEKNILPTDYQFGDLKSKGFYPEVTVQDFPLRDKPVFLHIKRRRWTVKATNKIISRDWSLVAAGTSLTTEFAAFLKEHLR